MSLRDEGRAFGTTTSNLKRLLVAIDQNAATLPDVSVEKAAVQAALADSEEAIRRKDFHLAQRVQATKDVKAALARGLDAGLRLQNAVRFKLGSKDEKLLEFQLKPLRKRPSPAVKRAKDAENRLAELEEKSKEQNKGDKAT